MSYIGLITELPISDVAMLLKKNYAGSECIETNWDYSGENLEEREELSAEACACACRNMLGCRYFTWTQDDNICYLKKAQGVQKQKKNAYSGGKDCCTGNYQNLHKILRQPHETF